MSVSNIEDLNRQKIVLLKQVQRLYNEMFLKVKKLFENDNSEIDTQHQAQLSALGQNQRKLNSAILKIDSCFGELDTFRSKPVDATLFLKIQDILSNMNQ